MNREELKQSLGDELCKSCAWKKGEIDRQCDGLCEGFIVMMLLMPFLMRTKVI